MSFPRVARLLGAATLLWSGCAPPAPDPAAHPAPSKPAGTPTNFLVVLVDTLAAGHLGYHGYGRATSPTIDAWSARAARFSHCISTYPQTAPSVASLFTALYPSAHKKTTSAEVPLTSSVTTLAATFRAAGYRTAAVTTNPHLSPGLGYEQGFERYFYIAGQSRFSLHENAHRYDGTAVDVRRSEAKHYGQGAAANAALLEWLAETRTDGRPWFAYLHYMDVHNPYVAPPPYNAQFVEAPGRDVHCNGMPSRALRPVDVDYTKSLYDGQIRYLDDFLAQVLTALEERGELAHTTFVFLADHGEEFMQHGGMGHGDSLYRELLHVPLFLVGPGIVPRTHESPVSLVDVYPTLCELAGLEPPAHVQGHSFARLLRGAEDAPSRGPVLAECAELRVPDSNPSRRAQVRNLSEPAYSLVDGEWHLIHRARSLRSELFRYREDPQETDDRAAAEPEVVQRLLASAQELWADSKALGERIEAGARSVDPATQAQLEALGYGGDAAADEGEE